MARGWMLYWTDMANAVAFGGLLATGAVLKWVLPHGGRGLGRGGSGRGGGGPENTLFGLDRHEWGDIHFWISVAAVVFVLLHLVQHLGWIGQATKRYLLGMRPARVRPGAAAG